MYACKKTKEVALHNVGDIRVVARRPDMANLIQLTQKVLWLKVGAIKDIGVSAGFLKRRKVRMEREFLTISDEKFVEGVIRLLGLRAAKTSQMPGKPIKMAEETLQEMEGKDIELYRKATGGLVDLSIDRRDMKYVAELARRMQKPQEVVMELLNSAR